MIPTTDALNCCVPPARTLGVAGERTIDCVVGFDEEIVHPKWYTEMSFWLLDNQVRDPVTGKVRNESEIHIGLRA